MSCIPLPKVSLITFSVYVLSDEKNVLTPVKAFVCLTLFDILKLPLVLLPMLIVYMVEVNESFSKNKINQCIHTYIKRTC